MNNINRDDVLRMAREAGIDDANIPGLATGRLETGIELLERLAKLAYTAGLASAAQGVEPVAYANRDDLDNMLDDSLASVAGVRDGYRKTPLYTAPPTAAAIEAQVKEACATVCERLIHGDGVCADNEVWIHDCADAIRSMPPMFGAPEDPNAKDAARYRWLRQQETWEPGRDELPEWYGGKVKWLGGSYSEDEIDAIIDAAMPALRLGGEVMTSDRELLEMAAKAVGLNLSWRFPVGPDLYLLNPAPELPNVRLSPEFIDEEGFSVKWNPLIDDGDALRLAVKIKWVPSRVEFVGLSMKSDPYAATRRAITRAAAEIGKAMEVK